MNLIKGGNLPLPRITTAVVISCAWVPNPPLDADLSALLLVGGKVRTDDDFVFYNQPAAPDGSVQHLGKKMRPDGSASDRVSVDLSRVAPAIDSIAFVISLDGPAGAFLADLRTCSATVHAADGAPITVFEISDLVAETAAITVELYRRDNRWKVRAVGQGYSDGLAGLARDFGVTVDETEPEPLPDEAPPPAALTGAAGAAPVGPPPIDWSRPPVPAGYEI